MFQEKFRLEKYLEQLEDVSRPIFQVVSGGNEDGMVSTLLEHRDTTYRRQLRAWPQRHQLHSIRKFDCQ
jgi:hypothetical protein